MKALQEQGKKQRGLLAKKGDNKVPEKKKIENQDKRTSRGKKGVECGGEEIRAEGS